MLQKHPRGRTQLKLASRRTVQANAEIKIDYDKLGELMKTTAKSQRNAMGVIRKKLGLSGVGGAPASPAAASPAKVQKQTPKRTPAKRKIKELTPSDSDSWGNSPPAEWAVKKRLKTEEETKEQTPDSGCREEATV